MTRRIVSVETPVAHLVGPGKLKVINGRLAFATQNASPVRLDPQTLENILCYGNVGITDEAFNLLFQHNVAVAWMTPAGNRCRGRVLSADASTTALRVAQHRALANPTQQLELARWLVTEKIVTQLNAARHYQRQGRPDATGILTRLRDAHTQCLDAPTLNVLRGIEGAATAAWFQLFGQLLLPPWQFTQRIRRPPTDPVNALLSLGYTLLARRVEARCEAFGLEVALGALHEFHPGRLSLACDLMEPFRIPVVDRWTLKLCNEGRIAFDDFVNQEPSAQNAGVRLHATAFPRIIHSWEEHYQAGGNDKILHTLIQQLIAKFRHYSGSPADAAQESVPVISPTLIPQD